MKILITCILFTLFLAPNLAKFASYTHECDIMRHLPPLSEGVLTQNEDKPYYLSDKKLIKELTGEVSAYTLGRVEENDAEPCIGASNEDMCKMAKQGKLMFANNYYKLGTIVCIDTIGCGEVKDRMNARYGQNNFDVAGLDLQKNLDFGRQKLAVRIYKK